ncbi:MAG TPA: metallophosphoesterase family protein [Acidobacteriaceae bacterium]|nr:metallophosphoesterase family protein [Acidobacteriaceae bacterium]
MRVAALYDIHGNLPALESVLDELEHSMVDRIVVGGDLLGGPMQTECIQRLRALSVPVDYLMGNTDREVIAVRRGEDNKQLRQSVLDVLRWSARQLSPEDDRWVASWPRTVRMQITSLGRVLFCHATPRDDNEIFTSRTEEDRLVPIFAPANADVVVCGHTHMQFDRRVGSTRVVNAGSVGMPFGTPGADWLLLGPEVELRHTCYDRDSAKRRMATTGFPTTPEFDMLSPRAAEEMLRLYASAQLKA